MAKIKDILSIKLEDDIKSVIDLNSTKEELLKEELDNFILTESLAKHLSEFCDRYLTDVKQTGIWLSGFYGSGKSYLAKIIGLLLSNRMLLGTSVHDRFKPKLHGLKQQNLIENNINALNRTRNHVVQFDAAKESSNFNLSQMMLAAFLRSLSFLDNWYGLLEYDLWLEGRYDEFEARVKDISGVEWKEARKSIFKLPKLVREAILAMGNSLEEYNELKALYENRFNNYDANKLVDDLQRYIDKYPDTRIVYMIDEVSESIMQERINILDLEGISEALTSMGKKVWTVAIAQQKLDDVISSTNIDKSKLVKIIDRFRNRIDIKAEEVDTIIRQRLLAKTPEGSIQLETYFDRNSGMIGDITNLGSANLKGTKSARGYADYYPFFEHQFKMLQYFLFGSKALTQTQIGTRGMLISAFDILKREAVQDRDVYQHVTAAQLRRQSEETMSEALANRCQMADAIVKAPEYKLIKGADLLQTIDFLTRTDAIRTTAENIAKAYVSNPDLYYEVKAEIVKALDALAEERILIFTDNQYRITSEAEERIINDLHNISIYTYRTKNKLVENLKGLQDAVRKTFYVMAGGKKIDFASKMNSGESLSQNQSSSLKVMVHDVMTVNANPNALDEIKQLTSNAKDMISLVPEASRAEEIFSLQEEILRLDDLDNRTYSTAEEKTIVSQLTSIKPDKEKALTNLLEEAYCNGKLVYCYNVTHLNPEHYAQQIADVQLRAYNNVYTRRLKSELSDTIASQVLKKSNSQLKSLFTSDEFAFFDTSGQFIGNQLAVVTEIMNHIKSYTSGADLEKILEDAPTGYEYGTIVTTLAALFRANKIIVKYNGEEYHSYNDPMVEKVFTNTTAMRKADFKAVAKSLSYKDRKEIVDILKECNYTNWTSSDVNYQKNDFELVDAVRQLSMAIMNQILTNIMGDPERQRIFNRSVQAREVLKQYTTPVTEATYYATAQKFLQDEEYETAVELAERDLNFIKNGWKDLNDQRQFIDMVADELEKALGSAEKIEELRQQFLQLMESNPVKNVKKLSQITQDIRDIYYTNMEAKAKSMTKAYDTLCEKVEELKQRVLCYPKEWNADLLGKIAHLISLCKSRHIDKVVLPANSVKSSTGYLLRDFVYAIDKVTNFENELVIWESGIITTPPPPPGGGDPDPIVRQMRKQLPTGKLGVSEYRAWLSKQLSIIAKYGPKDILDFD